MWLLLAIVLSAIVLFYLFAFYISVVAWLNALGHLFRGNFIRCALWLDVGIWMLFWWNDSDTRTLDWDHFLPGACFFIGLGALATFARYCSKRKAMQAVPTMPVWTPPFEATGNIAPIIEVEYKRLPN